VAIYIRYLACECCIAVAVLHATSTGMQQFPILYSFRRCPYAMRARLSILVSGLTVEIREVSLADKPAQMVAASPKATIPVLVLPDRQVLDESLDIMAYALEAHDPLDWLRPLTPETAVLIAQIDGAFKYHLDRYKYPDRYQDEDRDLHRDLGLKILASMDGRLCETEFLAGSIFSLVDAAIAPFVRQFEAVDPAWFADQPIPSLKKWLTTFLASSLFEAAMVTLPVWRDGDATTLFPASVSN
jgi:glutathione S-transferase